MSRNVTANAETGAVLIQGSEITAQDQVAIAGDDVRVVDQKELNYQYSETRKSGFGGWSKSSSGRINRQEILKASRVVAEEQNLDVISASNLTIMGSELRSGGEMNLEAVDDILVTADQVLTETKSWDYKSSFNPFNFDAIYESETTRKGEVTTTAVGSSLQAGGDINVNGSRATVIGSDVVAEGDINATTDVGDIDVLSADQSSQSTYHHEKIKVGFSDIAGQILDVEQQIKNLTDLDNGQIKLSIAKAEYDRTDSESQSRDGRASQIVSNNSVNLDSAGDITVQGSDVIADADANASGDVNLTAGGDVAIVEANRSSNTETKEVSGEAELSLVVQHQAVEVAKAARAVEDAKDQLKQAEEDYRQYQKDIKQLNAQRDSLEAQLAADEPGIAYSDIVELNDLIDELEVIEQIVLQTTYVQHKICFHPHDQLHISAHLKYEITLCIAQIP